jgi:hypothetical protein
MPLPLLFGGAIASAGISAIIVSALRYFFMAHAAAAVIRIFSVLGIAWATNEFLMEPLLDQAQAAWTGMPAGIAQWLGAFGIDKVVSIMISAYTILGIKNLVLRKA